jgi:peroxiredoxin Q/BCP
MSGKQRGLEVGRPGVNWELTAPDGKLITSNQFLGRPLLMFFFRGTWCPSCRSQMLQLRDNWEKLEAVSNVVGIVSEEPNMTREFLSHNPLPYLLLPDPERNVVEAHNIYRKFGLDGFRVAIPTTIILDSIGIVRYCYVGNSQFDRPSIDEVVRELVRLPMVKSF